MVSIKALQERVSSLFYAHGLFCASHPVPIISLVIVIFIFLCFPLMNLPLPGNAPLQYATPVDGYKIPPILASTADSKLSDSQKPPRWYFASPIAYVQQIVVKSVVSPWEPNRLIPADAFRAPLAQVFDVVEQINNFYYKEGDQSVSLSDVCLHVSETSAQKKVKGLLPEYKCLTISPANFWNHDREWFSKDKEIVKTIFQPYGNGLDSTPSIIDILFGVPRQEMGIKKMYLRNRQRVVSYAITMVYNKYNPKFVSKLRDKLQTLYPLSKISNNTNVQHMSHIHYKSVNHFVEHTPLLVTYVVLFLYLYFSVRKIEMVKSKWGLALSAVVTVFASLLMSVSICLTFGLTPSLSGSEIFPYLVIIIGLENVLVVTKSVVSTPVHLDVKLRVAQGLSKEGWYIFKNLMAELAILVVGFFTFVPAIQEFCLFAVVGLLTDFFLQMFFYATVLSIDMRRMELSDLHKRGIQQDVQKPSQDCVYPMPLAVPGNYSGRASRHGMTLNIPQSYPRLPTPPPSPANASPADDMFFVDPTRARTPRRVKILNFWARTRVAQRGIMACVVVWIVLIVYKTGIVDHLTQTNLTDNFEDPNGASFASAMDKLFSEDNSHSWADQELKINNGIGINGDGYLNSILYHDDREMWKRLSHPHWMTLLSFYNISMQGRYMTILPTIHLSSQITSDAAIAMRHPDEVKQAAYSLKQERPGDNIPDHEQGAQGQNLSEHSPAAPNESLTLVRVIRRLARVPRTKLELALTILLGLASLILLIYFFAALYRCLCSRNYAKWRSSWAKTRKPRKSSPYYKQIREAVPKVLEGHPQAVECVVTDGPLIASSCLEGQIRVWDSNSGECIAQIQRKSESSNGTRDSQRWRDSTNGIDADPESTFSASPSYMSTSPGAYMPTTSKPPMSRSWSATSPSPQPTRHRSVDVPPKGHSRSKSIGVNLSEFFPDLTETIETDFCALYNRDKGTLKSSVSSQSLGSALTPGGGDQNSQLTGYDFSNFQKYYSDHEKYLEEKSAHMSMRRRNVEKKVDSYEDGRGDYGEDSRDRRSWSFGDHPGTYDTEIDSALSLSDTSLAEFVETPAPPVWCLTCQDNLVVAGCQNGQIEFWDGLTGQLKFVYHDNHNGVTAMCFVANRVIAARINGSVDFIELETFISQQQPAAQTTSSSSRLHCRGHMRQPSSSSLNSDLKTWDGILQCSLLSSTRAHQKPINLIQSEGGRVVTASQDHTLKVFRLEDSFLLFTLHGHTGSVTTLFIDKISPSSGASGAEDGTVRVWDLVSGSCVHKLEGHNGGVTSLTCTQVYIISSGADDRLCVWERWKGHLMHKIQMEPGYCNSLGMLTSNLMVTGGQGCLYLWDVQKGEVLRGVKLDDHDNSVFIRQIQVMASNMVVCDYGRSLIVIQFPAVLEKAA